MKRVIEFTMLAIFLDIETTGLDPKIHHNIDIAFTIIDITSKKERVSYQSILRRSQDEWKQRDPKSMEINGYTWEDIKEGKDPLEVKNEIITIFEDNRVKRGNAVFICQNPAFDRMFLTQLIDISTQEKLNWPYHWLDLASMYWALKVKESQKNDEAFPKAMTLSKNEIAKLYNLPPEEFPHRAINGVNHLIQCYQAVLQTNFELHAFTRSSG